MIAARPETAGYADAAAMLLRTGVPFEENHAPLLPLLPAPPADALDIGAGPGHDAAHLARMGYRVVAAEPVAALRNGAAGLHGAAAIWLDDALPRLTRVRALDRRFDLILVSGVWHHLRPAARATSFATIAALLAPGGILALTLRHGPVPPGRTGFAVSAPETLALARLYRFKTIVTVARDSIQATNRAAGVTWTYLIFRAPLFGEDDGELPTLR